jgi:hypothetical protein
MTMKWGRDISYEVVKASTITVSINSCACIVGSLFLLRCRLALKVQVKQLCICKPRRASYAVLSARADLFFPPWGGDGIIRVKEGCWALLSYRR